MKKLFIAAMMLFSLNVGVQAQSVVRHGNAFIQVSDSKSKTKGKEIKTQYTYTDSKGNSYDIYLSSTGKAFIKKISKKTGKEYPVYLPEVGREINPSAYEEKKKQPNN